MPGPRCRAIRPAGGAAIDAVTAATAAHLRGHHRVPTPPAL